MQWGKTGIPISDKDRLQILAISFKRVLASSSPDAIVGSVLLLFFHSLLNSDHIQIFLMVSSRLPMSPKHPFLEVGLFNQ